MRQLLLTKTENPKTQEDRSTQRAALEHRKSTLPHRANIPARCKIILPKMAAEAEVAAEIVVVPVAEEADSDEAALVVEVALVPAEDDTKHSLLVVGICLKTGEIDRVRVNRVRILD